MSEYRYGPNNTTNSITNPSSLGTNSFTASKLGKDFDAFRAMFDKSYYRRMVNRYGMGYARDRYGDQFNQLTDAELRAVMNQYTKKSGWGWFTDYDLDEEAFKEDLADYMAKANQLGDMPGNLDFTGLTEQAGRTIDNENNQLLGMIDSSEQDSLRALDNSIGQSNQAFGAGARQLQSNNYTNNAQLMGTVQGSMSKARQSALEAGANAGLRIASNINTIMSVQNKQNQQSLETSNNLAQMLLNQQQANAGFQTQRAGIRSSSNANRAGVIGGSASRKLDYASGLKNNAQQDYDNRMRNWEENYSATMGTNPLGDVYKNQQIRNRNNQSGY